jgi:hypothetical protein
VNTGGYFWGSVPPVFSLQLGMSLVCRLYAVDDCGGLFKLILQIVIQSRPTADAMYREAIHI